MSATDQAAQFDGQYGGTCEATRAGSTNMAELLDKVMNAKDAIELGKIERSTDVALCNAAAAFHAGEDKGFVSQYAAANAGQQRDKGTGISI